MSHVAATPQHRQARQTARAREAFRDSLGPNAEMMRAAEIAALPSVTWKGKSLKTLRCHGTTGNGPHDCNVPEGLLWALLSLQDFHCVFHPREELQKPAEKCDRPTAQNTPPEPHP